MSFTDNKKQDKLLSRNDDMELRSCIGNRPSKFHITIETFFDNAPDYLVAEHGIIV